MGPDVHVLQTIPKNGATEVPTGQSIRVQFDRFLGADVATRQSINIQGCSQSAVEAGTGGFVPCAVLSAAEYDPVQRVAVWKPQAMPPTQTTSLLANTRYTVQILAPTDEGDSNGIRAFDGAPLAETYTFSFTTGVLVADEPKRDVDFCYDGSSAGACALPSDLCSDPKPATVTTAGPRDILAVNDRFTSCSDGSSCHSAGSDSRTTLKTLPLGFTLDLSTDQAIRGMIGRVAQETANGPSPGTPSSGARSPFGTNMPYVDPGNPANSYLLNKILMGLDDSDVSTNDSNTYACSDLPDASLAAPEGGTCPSDAGPPPPNTPPVTTQGDTAVAPVDPWISLTDSMLPAPGEYDRLRAALHGQAMPAPPLFGPRKKAHLQDALTLSAWIAAKAKVDTCQP